MFGGWGFTMCMFGVGGWGVAYIYIYVHVWYVWLSGGGY